MTIDFAHFGLDDVEEYRNGLKNQTFPTLLVELTPHRPPFCSQ